MATRTTNYGLYKPDPTDNFGDFLSEFNANMDEIDNNLGGGGGSGGHTIVNPSGSDMPAEGKLQFTGGVTVTDDSVNGKTVVDISGGGGNVYGAFIDTNRVITSGQYSSGSPLSYTATEDCFVYGVCTLTNNTSGSVSIDGVQVGGWYNGGGTTAYNFGFLVKNGQTITASQTFSGNSDYKVYGLTQGTNGIFTPIIYSDTERVVGVWRDNKPLYQKTVSIGTLPNNATKLTAHGISDIDTICSIDGIAYDGSGKTLPLGYINVDSYTYDVQVEVGKVNVEIKTKIDFSSYTGYITVQYTKTTDVAGSGNWNTEGVPTVHYSTSEQVIGTWLGKPLYQRTWDFSGSPVMLTYGTWVNSGISAGENIKAIISAELKYGTVANMGVEVAVNADGYPVAFQKIENTGNTRGVSYCTLKYTKTTD